MFNDRFEIYTLSIVFLGDFNPVIVQPFWLANKKLIGEREAEDIDIKLIHKDLVSFKADWFTLELNKARFEIRTSQQPYFEAIRDLTLGTFKFLKETPINGLGINHIFHIPFRDAEQNRQLGYSLVSLDKFSGFFRDPRVLNLQVVEQKRADGRTGNVSVALSPSTETTSKWGLAININDNFMLAPDQTGRESELVELLNSEWQNSLDRAKIIADGIWSTFAAE